MTLVLREVSDCQVPFHLPSVLSSHFLVSFHGFTTLRTRPRSFHTHLTSGFGPHPRKLKQTWRRELLVRDLCRLRIDSVLTKKCHIQRALNPYVNIRIPCALPEVYASLLMSFFSRGRKQLTHFQINTRKSKNFLVSASFPTLRIIFIKELKTLCPANKSSLHSLFPAYRTKSTPAYLISSKINISINLLFELNKTIHT